MTTNPIKATITESGKEAIPQNPFLNDDCSKCSQYACQCQDWGLFEQAHPKRELVTPRADLANSVQEVVEVWQIRFKNRNDHGQYKVWHDISEEQYNNRQPLDNRTMWQTRICYQLVEAVKEEKPKSPVVDIKFFIPEQLQNEIHNRLAPEPTTPIVQGSEESVEAKAQVWFGGMAESGYNRDTIFEAGYQQGYQQRNYEVLAIIEAYINKIPANEAPCKYYDGKRDALNELLKTYQNGKI